MDPTITGEQQLLIDTIRRFVESGAPIARARATFETPDFDAARWQEIGDLGWLEMGIPLFAEGDAARDALSNAAIVIEELGRYVQREPLVPALVATALIAQYGSSELREAVLAQILDGNTLAIWCFPSAVGLDTDFGRLPVAQISGEKLVLSGSLGLIQEGRSARLLVVPAMRDDGAPIDVVVSTDASGVRIEPLASLDITRRYANAYFSDVEVPMSNVLDLPRDAEAAILRQIAVATSLQCAETVGAADRILELTLEYLPSRSTFGRAVSSYQAIKHRLADIYLHLEASKAITTAAIRGVLDDDGGLSLASIAKSHVIARSTFLMEECLQFHGAIGFTWEHDLHLYLRRARMNGSVFGSTGWHRTQIARASNIGSSASRLTAVS